MRSLRASRSAACGAGAAGRSQPRPRPRPAAPSGGPGAKATVRTAPRRQRQAERLQRVGVSCASTGAKDTPKAAPAPSNGKAARKIVYTAYEGNSFSTVFSQTGINMLVDPWLVGDLTFADQYWLYRGTKKARMPDIEDINAQSDFLLLSQGLDDHCHRPTLQRLSPDLPVVCSPSAAVVVKELGFTNITSLEAGEQCTVCNGKLSIKATAGALVGPPWSKREAGFIIKECVPNGVSMYYEPHCDFDFFSLRSEGPVDYIVSPAVSVDLAGYPLVKGYDGIADLVKMLRPTALIPLNNAEIAQDGPLSMAINNRGRIEELPYLLRAGGMGKVKVAVPKPVEPLTVELP